MIILIAAADQNNALSKNNQLLWHLPNDFKHFKNLTSGNYIIMGRKTFETFPKPLPNRTHIIISRSQYQAPEGCITVNSLHEAIQKCPKDQDIYIIGGGQIYQQAINIANKIELTRVHHHFEADTFFPEIDPNQWQLIQEHHHPSDEKHAYSFTFQTYIKK